MRFEYTGSELTDAILIKACESLVKQGHTPCTILLPNGTAKGRKKVTIVTHPSFLGINLPAKEIMVVIRIEPENVTTGSFSIEYRSKPNKEKRVSRVHV
ncbi:MAG: hypothetical protein UZ21_OP11001000729 [Microgenomates bacterium OLB22]|nr:MAG: hypothetical protein UZ21_OP11001000729 [Microgenomates bacterium OLB22]